MENIDTELLNLILISIGMLCSLGLSLNSYFENRSLVKKNKDLNNEIENLKMQINKNNDKYRS